MPIRELRAKYGRNLKGREAVNHAIRAELVAGDECLEALNLANQAARKLRNLPGTETAEMALTALQQLRDILSEEIAHRYGLKSRQASEPAFGSGDGT